MKKLIGRGNLTGQRDIDFAMHKHSYNDTHVHFIMGKHYTKHKNPELLCLFSLEK